MSSSLHKVSLNSTIMRVKKVFHKILNYRVLSPTPKSPIFFTISVLSLVFLLYAESLIINISVYPAKTGLGFILGSPQTPAESFGTRETRNKVLEAPATSKIERQVESTSNIMPILTPTAQIEENSRQMFTKQENVIQESKISLLKMEDKVEEISKRLLNIEANNAEEEAEDGTDETPDSLVPPSNVTREERMKWFRNKLPELEILKSTDLSKKFHGRVLEFFKKQCTIQFFMAWLSPARFFGKRDFLAANTLLKAHPQACLMIISRSLDTKRGFRILKPLLERGFKVIAVTPDLPFLVKDTPAEAWLEEMRSGNKDPGCIPLSNNLSNLVRLAMLYKYGGVYLDTDVVVLKAFTGLRNAIGAQSIDPVTRKWTRLNGAVMIFDIGHPILLDFLQDFATNFNGNKWGHNGPYLVSRVIEKVGSTPGYNLTVLSRQAFYPFDWMKITRLFKKPETKEESDLVQDMASRLSNVSFAVHLWNRRTSMLEIEKGSVIEKLINDHCVICQEKYNSKAVW